MIFRRKICIASATLAFMLFSALSPAMAAALFAGDAQVLGRMLQVPAEPATSTSHEGHQNHHASNGNPHEHHADKAAPGSDTECADHGVFCSFCLSASSTTTLPLWSAPLWYHAADGGEKISITPPPAPLQIRAGARHLRDPPLLLS